MAGLNPYSGYSQQQRMGGPYGGGYGGGYGGMGAYGGGMGYGSRYGGMYGMGMKPPGAAVTGPVGSSSGSNPEAYAQGAQQMEAQQERAEGATANLNSVRQNLTEQGQEDQAKNIAAYRQARDTGIGRDNANISAGTRLAATQAGADPSADLHDVAAAQSGAFRVGADGRMTGGDTGNGTVQPNEADVAAAARAAQLAKGGASALPALGQQPTGANPLTAGIAPHAVQTNDAGQADAQRKAYAAGIAPPPVSPGGNAMTLRPMAGVASQTATQPPQSPVAPTPPIAPVTGRMMSLPAPFSRMSPPRTSPLGSGPSAPPMARRPKPAMAGAANPFQ